MVTQAPNVLLLQNSLPPNRIIERLEINAGKGKVTIDMVVSFFDKPRAELQELLKTDQFPITYLEKRDALDIKGTLGSGSYSIHAVRGSYSLKPTRVELKAEQSGEDINQIAALVKVITNYAPRY